MEQLSKEGLMEYLDIDESEYESLKEQGLIPDHSEESEKKLIELYEKGKPFTYDELMFLGHMDLQLLSKNYPAEAEEYMDM